MVRPIESGYIQQQQRVHFSPVVTYREQHACLRPIKSKLSVDKNNEVEQQEDELDSGDGKNLENCERVTVHIQNLPSLPTVQKVQMQRFERVQVSVPSQDGSGCCERYALEVNVPSFSSPSASLSVVNDDAAEEEGEGDSECIHDHKQSSSSYFVNDCHEMTATPTTNGLQQQSKDYYYNTGFFRNVINQRNSNGNGNYQLGNSSEFETIPKLEQNEEEGSVIIMNNKKSSVFMQNNESSATEKFSTAPKSMVLSQFDQSEKVKKSFVKSKLSFLHRFTLGRLGGSSNNSTRCKSKTTKTSVPVSTWSFKSAESTRDSPPVTNSCSSCAELCQIKTKKSIKARNPVVLHKVGPRTTCYHHPHANVNGENGGGTSSITRRKEEEEDDDDDEKSFVINTSYTVALKGNKPKDKNLGSRNIPSSNTWHHHQPTADHFVREIRVRNEEPAVFSPDARNSPVPKNIQRDHQLVYPISTNISTGVNYTIDSGAIQLTKNRTVATSPIRHLSTFYSLNLPVVSNRFSSSTSVVLNTTPLKSFSDVSSTTVPPVPKPRTKKTLLGKKINIETTEEDTDELSANVDRILDEIESLKMEINDELLLGSSPETRKETDQELFTENVVIKLEVEHHQGKFQEDDDDQKEEDDIIQHIRMPIGKPPLPPSKSPATREQFFWRSDDEQDSRAMSGTDLEVKLLEIKLQLYRSREELLAKSHLNLEEIADTVRSSMVIDRSKKRQRTLPPLRGSRSGNPENPPDYTTNGQIHPPTPDPVTIENKRCRTQEWSNLYNQVSQNYLRSKPSLSYSHGNTSSSFRFTGIVLETDLDSGTSREIIGGRIQDGQLLEQDNKQQHYEWNNSPIKIENTTNGRVKPKHLPLSIFPDDGRLSFSLSSKTQSLLNLGSSTTTMSQQQFSEISATSSKVAESGKLSIATSDERARSMEFLLDDSDKNAHLRPPENNLMAQKENRQLSEHELRVQRSLTKLNVPEWYTKYATSKDTSGSSAGQSSTNKAKSLAGGWSGLSSSKTSSLTSLQSTGRTHFSRFRTGTASSGARSSRESLMSPSSTASASPSPYYERSSFTYGMPYSLSRFASARMSCGASPASLSPSPSPVGGVGIAASPVSSAPLSRHHSYSKAPYMGWRSQERLTSKALYRTPAERLAADFPAQKQKESPSSSTSVTDSTKGNVKDTPEICLSTSPNEKKGTASDLSLNNSEESNSHKLNRVRSSIKEVSNAIQSAFDYDTRDESVNGGASPRKGFIWLESSFVGTKPLDSPGTPDTPQVITCSSNSMKSRQQPKQHPLDQDKDSPTKESPTLEDILDSLLALRRPDQKKSRGHTRELPLLSPKPPPQQAAHIDPISDWQERMNQPLQDTVYFPITDDFFPSPLTTTTTANATNYSDSANSANFNSDSYSAVNSSASPFLLSNANDNERTGNSEREFANFSLNHDFFSGNNEKENEEGGIDIISPRDIKVSDSTSTGVELDENDLLQRHDEDMSLDKENEDAFGNPTEIFSTVNSSCNAVNIIASSLNDPSSPTPTRHRRVSFDLDISDKEEKSSSRSRRDESVGGTICCRNSKCGKTATGLEARREFKTCHNCNAYYCSRECRRADWEKKHKKVCMQSRVGALCKQIINHVKEDSFVVSQLSAVARRGLLAKGRGCVKLFFSSPVRAERFLTGGLPELPEPWYIPINDILPEEMGAHCGQLSQTFTDLSEQCRTYNGENRFVLYVSVCVVNEVPTSGAVKWEREMISRSSKIRILMPRNYDENQMHHHAASAAHLFPSTSDEQPQVPPHLHQPTDSSIPPPLPPHGPSSSDNGDTLILRSVPGPTFHQMSGSDHRRLRELSFTNIQKHLNERGVDLRVSYPDIYQRLCNYVENDDPFLPVTIYPRNNLTGVTFVCVIMPDSSESSALADECSGGRHVETINISEHLHDHSS